jgi:hypothetical protein
MDDSEFERLLKKKYAQVVLKALLDADGYSCAFSALREKVNVITADDSRGAKETNQGSEYFPASLSSLLSTAKDAGIVDQDLTDDGQIRWQLRPSQLSQTQKDEIRSRNRPNKIHTDTSSVDFYQYRHTDSEFTKTN